MFHHNYIDVIQLYHKTLQGNVYIELIALWNFRTETSARLPLITVSQRWSHDEESGYCHQRDYNPWRLKCSQDKKTQVCLQIL